MRPLLTGLTFRRPFTILGILLALLVIAAFVLVALNAGAASNSPQLQVVVASKELTPRIAIDLGSLELKTIPVAASYPKDYFFTKKEDVQGLIPLVPIHPGQAVIANDVAKPNQALGSQAEYLPIPSGYVAITIPTSEQQGVANYINPNDYISVIATVSSGQKVASKTVFTNLHVIRVGTQSAPGTNASSTSLTVVVTECQAEVITWFLTYAALKYSLQSFKDYLQPGTLQPDPKCPTVGDAKGVTLQFMQATYPGLF
ncbi:MAG TPA: Flp pilus assembly protein CpaB [Candidatus Nitrosotalea sp.]|nr:Flp pilus assembly protein CpaB [Candidatus Nitrosotalea sp.]